MVKDSKSKIRLLDGEPTWKIDAGDEAQLSQMLTWYNYHRNSEDAKKYFLDFLRHSGESPDMVTKIQQLNDIPLNSTIGFLCRIKLVNGDMVPAKYDERIEFTKNKVLQVVQAKEGVDSNTTPEKRASVQEHLENQLRELLGELSGKVDDFLLSKCKTSFGPYDWFKDRAVKHQQARNIAEYFDKCVLKELKEAEAGTCEQLTEAYSFLKKNDLKKYIGFIETIISDAIRWSDVAKQISLNNRAPRAKKPKPALKQIEKLQFLKEHESLKSIPPTQIVGATQLWVYNIKYRTLGVYQCNNQHGFSVKGCTILNFDASESVYKTLRKPEDVIPKVLEGGKVALRKVLPSIRAKEKKLTGRINRDTILLKVL